MFIASMLYGLQGVRITRRKTKPLPCLTLSLGEPILWQSDQRRSDTIKADEHFNAVIKLHTGIFTLMRD